MSDHPARVMFTYWGRRGALTQFALEAGRVALADPQIKPTISVSRQNEGFGTFAEFGSALFPVETFATHVGALLCSGRIASLRRRLGDRLSHDRTDLVIELMPHVWSPLIMPKVRLAGARYCTVVHDARAHPGDRTGWVKAVLDRQIRAADIVATLSTSVAEQLQRDLNVPSEKLVTLFHPDLSYGSVRARRPPSPNDALRLLFLGRILPYKGLPLFVDLIERLRREGLNIEAGVYGEGHLGEDAERLRTLGVTVVNRWLAEAEIAEILPQYHAIVLSHTEASQSGVAAAALGAGLPVIATPVGGLVEQIADGVTGVLARRADVSSLAEAAKRLLLDQQLYESVCRNITHLSGQRSMSRFVRSIVTEALKSSTLTCDMTAVTA